jgi:hypothetical protein
MNHLDWMKRQLEWLLKLRDMLEENNGYTQHRLFPYVDKTTGKRFGVLPNELRATYHTYIWHKQRWLKEGVNH